MNDSICGTVTAGLMWVWNSNSQSADETLVPEVVSELPSSDTSQSGSTIWPLSMGMSAHPMSNAAVAVSVPHSADRNPLKVISRSHSVSRL